jgi:hypothetical protein
LSKSQGLLAIGLNLYESALRHGVAVALEPTNPSRNAPCQRQNPSGNAIGVRLLADQDRVEASRTGLVLARFGTFGGPFGAPKRPETKGNRLGDGRGRRIFFLSGAPVVRVPRRKPAPETTFGFGVVRRVGPKVLREAAKFDSVVERISVHNIMPDQ